MSASIEPGPVPPSSGDRPLRDDLVLDGEGQHVGGSLLPEEPFVERGHGGLVHEEQRDLGVAHDPLGLEHRPGQGRPPLDVDGLVGLLVGHVEVEGHQGSSDGGPPLVGGHDVGHDAVADHVPLGQVDEGQVGDAGQHRLQADQPGSSARARRSG